MATFSENQVRHLYVVKSAADFTASKDKGGALYFSLKDANGKPVRSDLIENIMHAKATSYVTLRRKTRVAKVTMSGNPVIGEDYVLTINYRKFVSQSDENFYQEIGAAHATTTTASDVLLELAKNLAQNTKKQEMVEIAVVVNNAEKAISAVTSSDVVTAILIKEIAQPWIRGIKAQEPVEFVLSYSNSKLNASTNEPTIWGADTDASATFGTTIGNGKKMADYEYFLMGERGDQYRMKGWPNVVETKYLVDETKEYDAIDLHYAYIGANHAIQKSEKDITLLMADHETALAVLGKINAQVPGLLVAPDDWDESSEA